ncbi:MAG: P-loop NTPase, partial [Tistlia sp.]
MTQASLAALARPPSHLPTAPQLLAIASGKGGVGKTWLAITLSHAMARAGGKVLLFDGDLGLANVDIQLG